MLNEITLFHSLSYIVSLIIHGYLNIKIHVIPRGMLLLRKDRIENKVLKKKKN